MPTKIIEYVAVPDTAAMLTADVVWPLNANAAQFVLLLYAVTLGAVNLSAAVPSMTTRLTVANVAAVPLEST